MITDEFPQEDSFASLSQFTKAYADLRAVAIELERLALKVANLNPKVPVIGAGMLAQLVTEARTLTEQ